MSVQKSQSAINPSRPRGIYSQRQDGHQSVLRALLHFYSYHFLRIIMAGQSCINHLTLANPRQYEIMAHFSGWLTSNTLHAIHTIFFISLTLAMVTRKP